MKFSLFIVPLLFFVLVVNLWANPSENPEAVESARKLYDTADKTKQPYIAELEKAIATAQRQGNLRLYTELEQELNHTKADGWIEPSEYRPKTNTLLQAKAKFKRGNDTARQTYRQEVEDIAANLLKAGKANEAKAMSGIAERIPAKPAIAIPSIDLGETIINLPKVEPDRKFTRHTGGISATVWSSDGTRIVSAAWDKKAIVWDAKTGERQSELTLDSQIVTLAYTPDDKQVLLADAKKTVLWDIETNTKKWQQDGGEFIHKTAVSPDGKIGCSADPSGNRNLIFRNMADGKIIHGINANGLPVYDCDFHPKGDLLVAGMGNNAVIFDVKTAKPVLELSNGHTESVRASKFSPDGRFIVTGSIDDSIVVWNARDGKPIKRLTNFGQDIIGIAFSRDGSKLAVMRNGLGGIIVSTKTWQPLSCTPWLGWWCSGQVSWSPDDKELAGAIEKDVIIWKIE